MTNTTTATKATKAQADLLKTIAKVNGPTGKETPAPVSGRYARSVKVLLANGWVSSEGANLYVVTDEGRKAAGLRAPAKASTAKATAKKATPAKASTTKASGTTANLAAVGGVAHPATTWLALLTDKGLSQTKAAQAMGVAPMTLNRLCNGHGIPTAKVTVRFAKAVGADPATVWRGVCDYELALALAAK